MGNNPIGIVKPPTRESFHLHMARLGYVQGDLSIEEFEHSVEHVLRGGTVNQQGRVRERDELPRTPTPFRRST